MRRIAALLFAVVPTLAAAQEAEPRWSLGAGVTLGGFLDSTSTYEATVPSVIATVERRLGSRTWAVAGVSAAIRREDRDREVAPPSSGVIYAAELSGGDFTGARLEAGIRRALTPASAPVELSILVLADVGLATRDLGEPIQMESRARVAGVSVGAAVERRLLDALSLRISASLARAAWSWEELETPTLHDERSAVEAGLHLAPALELRLAF